MEGTADVEYPRSEGEHVRTFSETPHIRRLAMCTQPFTWKGEGKDAWLDVVHSTTGGISGGGTGRGGIVVCLQQYQIRGEARLHDNKSRGAATATRSPR